MSISIQGTSFEQQAKSLEGNFAAAHEEVVLEVALAMERRVKVRTGATKLSISPRMISATQGEVTAEEGAVYLEFGTKYLANGVEMHTTPQPFAGPAIDEVEPLALRLAELAVEKAQ